MKKNINLGLILSVSFLGLILTYCRNKDNIKTTKSIANVQTSDNNDSISSENNTKEKYEQQISSINNDSGLSEDQKRQKIEQLRTNQEQVVTTVQDNTVNNIPNNNTNLNQTHNLTHQNSLQNQNHRVNQSPQNMTPVHNFDDYKRNLQTLQNSLYNKQNKNKKNEEEQIAKDQELLEEQLKKERTKYQGPTEQDFNNALKLTDIKLKNAGMPAEMNGDTPYLDYIKGYLANYNTIFNYEPINYNDSTEQQLIQIIGDNAASTKFDVFRNYFLKGNYNAEKNSDGKEIPLFLMPEMEEISIKIIQSIVARLHNIQKDIDFFKSTYRHKNKKIKDQDGNEKPNAQSVSFYIDKFNADIQALNVILGENPTWEVINSTNIKQVFYHLKDNFFITDANENKVASLDEIQFIIKQNYEIDKKLEEKLIHDQKIESLQNLREKLLSMDENERNQEINTIKQNQDAETQEFINNVQREIEARINEFVNSYNKNKTDIEDIISEDNTSISFYITKALNDFNQLKNKVEEITQIYNNNRNLNERAILNIENSSKPVNWQHFISKSIYGALEEDMEGMFKTQSNNFIKFKNEIIEAIRIKNPINLNRASKNIKVSQAIFTRFKQRDDNNSNHGYIRRILNDSLIANQFADFADMIPEAKKEEENLIKNGFGRIELNKLKDKIDNNLFKYWSRGNGLSVYLQARLSSNYEQLHNPTIKNNLAKGNATNSIVNIVDSLNSYIERLENEEKNVIPLGYKLSQQIKEFNIQLKILNN